MKPEDILLENAHTDLVFAICLSTWCPPSCNETAWHFIGNADTDLLFAICLSRWCPPSCNKILKHFIGKCTYVFRVCRPKTLQEPN